LLVEFQSLGGEVVYALVMEPLGELLPARATAQQANAVMAIHLPDNKVVRASVAKQLAFGIDTG
jgi:hypothetical protein